MPYSADVSLDNPGCFLFLVDQCANILPEHPIQEAAVDVVNRFVDLLVRRCLQGGEVQDYFDIGIVGFTDLGFLNQDGDWVPANDDDLAITYTLPGTNLEQPFLPMSQVVDAAVMEERKVSQNQGGDAVEVTQQMPVWLRFHEGTGTPLWAMLKAVERPLAEWVGRYPNSHPPIVIIVWERGISDVHQDLSTQAERIKSLRTVDGNVLLFAVDLIGDLSNSPDATRYISPTMFPENERDLTSLEPRHEDDSLMFRMVSALPETIRQRATRLEIPVDDNSRGMVLNAQSVEVARFLSMCIPGLSNPNLH